MGVRDFIHSSCHTYLPRPAADKKMDTDDPEHIGWLYKVAAARAKEFKIEGVTWSLTQGVVKNIIPAIASTNAIIAGLYLYHLAMQAYSGDHLIASCCNEAFKIATSSAAFLNNYFMLIGTDGVYSYTFEHEKRDDCPVCGGSSLELSIKSELTVEELIEMLVEKQDMYAKSLSLLPSSVYSADTLSTVKSRSPLSLHLLRRYICKHRHNLRRLRGPIYSKRSLSLFRQAAKSPSRPALYRSVSPCASAILDLCFSVVSLSVANWTHVLLSLLMRIVDIINSICT